MDIALFQPFENAIHLSCDTNTACQDMEINIINTATISSNPSNANWLNIESYTSSLNIVIFCNNQNSSISTQTTTTDDLSCDNNNICCPFNYEPLPNTTAFYPSSTEFKMQTTMQQLQINDTFLFEYFKEYIVWMFWLCFLYTSYVLYIPFNCASFCSVNPDCDSKYV